MAKHCPVCGAKLGFGKNIMIADGSVCFSCGRFASVRAMTRTEDIIKAKQDNDNRFSTFHKTSEIKKILSSTITIDEDHSLFYIGDQGKLKFTPIVHSFYEVIDYRTEIVGAKTITKSKNGIRHAVVGGMIAGPVGAIVGASTGKTETKEVGGTNVIEIDLQSPTGKKTIVLANSSMEVQHFLDRCISMRIAQESQTQAEDASFSAADELLKWKALLDQGAITQIEFEQKKRQLLQI